MKNILHKHHSQITEGEWVQLEMAGIVNGIGPSTMPFLRHILFFISPSFIYAESRKHDLGYYIGLTEERRRECDEGFFRAMIDDIGNSDYNFIKTIYYTFIAIIYYFSVRLLGRYCFNYTVNRFE